jgi:hypothetical protein
MNRGGVKRMKIHDGKTIRKIISADGNRMAILRPYKRRQCDGQYDVIYAWQCRFRGRIVIGGINENAAIQYVSDAAKMDYQIINTEGVIL